MRFCPRCGSRYEHERFCPEDGAPTEALPEAGPSKDALIGTLVDGRYRIEAQIGEGGMGVVYKATHVVLNKTLALKVLRGEVAKDPEVVQRFMQEAQSATSIGHENIIDINDFGKLSDGTAYFVMEFLRGSPLNDLIRRGGSIPTRDALQILRQVASALGAAHARGIVHRDLKPDNVFVLARGEIENFVKVLDFGIAKVGTTNNKLTRTGVVFGTPHYMSPEQAAGQSVDARTDIYALGVMMYEMFTGRVPFDADTFMGVLTKHMFEKPAPMFGGKAERSLGALEQITMRALEKKPENRYASMAALVDDLDRVVGGGQPRAIAGTRPSLELADALEPRSKSELNLARQQEAADSQPVLPTRKRWPLAVGALVAVLALVALVYVARRDAGVATAVPESTLAPVGGPTTPSAAAPVAEPPDRAGSTVIGAETPALGDDGLETSALTSEPSGAEIVYQGAIIGRTPGLLPRTDSQGHTVELRLDGYVTESFKLGAATPAKLHIKLRKRSAMQAKRPLATKKPSPKEASAQRRRMSSEVVDPWAD
jgi:eukaryotic-like serine/threonine-protein kinase